MPLHPESEKPGIPPDPPPDPQPTSHPAASEAQPLEPAANSSHPEVAVEEPLFDWDGHGRDGGPPPGDQPPPGDEFGHGDEEAPEMRKMSFLDHLDELRRRIIHSLIAIVVGFGVCWTFADELYAALALPITQILRELRLPDQLVYTNPTAPFTLYVQLALLAGLFLASPFVLLQVWNFISPGLYPRERKYAIPFIFLCSLLFISGGAFAYLIAFPAALRFLLNFSSQFRPMITVNEYFSLATTIILGLAIVFELPVLILFLTLLRVMTPGFLLRNFRYAVLVIFIAAATITPTPDIPTMMLFATPLMVLYLFGIGLSYLVLRGRAKEDG